LRQEPRAFLSTHPAGRGQHRVALAVVGASAAIFAALAPFAQKALAPMPAFVAAYQSALVIGDLVTAVLLFQQFAILRSRGLLALASGYLFTALLASIHLLTFPGLFAPSGLLGAGPQTTAWLYMMWHAGFPLLVIAYARSASGAAMTQALRPVLLAIGAVVLAAIACALLATSGASLLPAIMQGNRYTPAMITVVSSVWLLSMLALVVLWRRHPRSLLDLWLMVVMCAWIFDIALAAVLNSGRYDVGFYAGRVYGLLAAMFVLIMLLLENGMLYAQLNDYNARLEHRLAGIIDSAMDAILTTDGNLRIVLFNAAAETIFGCSRAQAIGAPIERFIPERFRGAHSAHMRRFGQTGMASRRMSAQRVVTGLRASGEEFPIDASISHITAQQHEYYTVILRDVTERARAEQALRQSREELHEMALVGATAREQEKARIARELHDELAQALTALKMDVLWLQESEAAANPAVAAKIAAMEQLLDGSVSATRRIAADLRPLMLDDLGLAPAAEWLADTFTKRNGVACRIAIDPADLDLDESRSTAVYRILQESLVNVAKHAEASLVEVQLRRSNGRILLQVRDNGCGFDPARPRKQSSFGIVGLREWVHLVAGTLRIDSAPGRGTCVEVSIPLPLES